jgi:peroxiredoxin
MSDDVYTLPPDLPVPEDDGAADHLVGMMLPNLRLESSAGPVSLREMALERLVLYIYPRTGRPGEPSPPGWDAIPGARGCTPESCAFRDHAEELRELGALLAGLSAQPLEEQVEFAERNHIAYPVMSDPELRLAQALRLPTFDVAGMTLYKRITLVVEACAIAKVFYPVFPPDKNAGEVVAWLRERA